MPEFNMISYAIAYNTALESSSANKHKKEHFQELKFSAKID